MKAGYLHEWNVSRTDAVRIQESLRQRIILRDEDAADNIRTIAGADISYNKGDDLFFAAVVLLKFPGMEEIETAAAEGRVDFPYIPGLLSFREGPILLKAFAALRSRPDVVLFDGQGIAHPRGIGLASHMGIFLDIPSIGCAKTKLFGSCEAPGEQAGDFSYLIHEGENIGAAVRTKRKVKPVCVSPGHKVSLKRAVEIVLSCCAGYRLPEPTRRAHIEVNRIRTERAKARS